MSNVDSLLDLDSPVENHGSKQTEIGSSLDPFDPFGPSPAFDSKGNDLLLSFESSVQNGTSTQQNGSENVNLLYEFESGNTNPLYNMTDDNLEDIGDEDLSALIKQQASDQDDSMVTETITRSEDDGQTTIVTTRRSRSYDSDREMSPEVTQVTEEVMTTSDDGTTVKKVITTTTTQAEYYDGDDSEISDRPSSYIDQSRNEQSYDEPPSTEQSYDEPGYAQQSYENQPSAEESLEERQYYEEERSEEPSLVEVSYEERQSFEDNPSFAEPSEESLVEISDDHKRRSMTPSPSSSDDEQGPTRAEPDLYQRSSMSPSRPQTEETENQSFTSRSFIQLAPVRKKGPDSDENDYMSLYFKKKSGSTSSQSSGTRRVSEEHPYETITFSRPTTAFETTKEEEIIKNGATFYRSKEADRDSSDEQEEVQTREARAPGQIKSPFFGDAPKPENGVDVDDVDRDPEIAREVRSKDNIKFAELNNFKNKFEAGVEGQKISTVSPEELEKLRQTTAAGSLKNKFENVAREEQNDNRERKGMREITPPQEGTKIVYETEPSRDPNVVRADDRVDEGEYMPKPGASREIMERFKSGKVQEQTTTKRTSVIDEIQKVEGGVFENEPQINPDVVRSGEGDVFADLPTSGSTRSVLSKFKQMESGGGGNVPAPRGVREITPPASGKVEYVSEPSRRVEKYEGKAESGVFESKPQERPDVVKSGRVVSENEETEELPQKGFTKSAAALFRQKEAEAGKTKTASTGGLRQITPPRDTPVVYESEPQRLPDVVRSEDKKEEEDLPQSGAAKNMLAKFRQWESTGGPQSETPRKPKEFTPPKEGGVFENTPQKFVPDYETRAEGGVFENQPQHREDVVRSEDRHVEELPEQGLARNMVARFRQMSESTKSQSPVSPRSPHDRSFKEFTPPRDDPRSTDRPGVQPSDMPEQYQQSSGGISENTPQKRDDVVREADTDYQAGLPTGNTTKSMLARFKAIQTEVKQKEQPKPLRKESPQLYTRPTQNQNMANTPKEGGTSRFRPVQPEKCAACRKTVYAMEKMEFNKNVYHKTCFKCSHCKNRLTPGTFSVNQGILYCLNHFKQMFKTKGNYDEGFGREQYKKKWKSEPNIAGLSDDDHSSYRS